jgi:hypothetical protein
MSQLLNITNNKFCGEIFFGYFNVPRINFLFRISLKFIFHGVLLDDGIDWLIYLYLSLIDRVGNTVINLFL